ncbi:unnamed protein product, partial [Mesorhabditis spiculigera]
MPRVCITGGGGYFGQRVAYEFLEQGYEANLLDINFEAPPPGIMAQSSIVNSWKTRWEIATPASTLQLMAWEEKEHATRS